MGGAILASSPYVDISKITLIKKTLHKFNFTKKIWTTVKLASNHFYYACHPRNQEI
jgi:hypothetical protein